MRVYFIKTAVTILFPIMLLACSVNNDLQKAQRYREAAVTIADNESDLCGCSSGSGILLKSKNGIILTASHVVGDHEGDSPFMCYIDASAKPGITLTMEDVERFVGKREYQCKILEVFKDIDIAVLQLVDERERGEVGAEIALGGLPNTGDTIYGIYSPSKRHGTFYKGYVAGVVSGKRVYYGPKEYAGGKMLIIDVPIEIGSSGAMVMNQDDKLVGIIVGGMEAGTPGYAIPIELVYSRIKKYLN